MALQTTQVIDRTGLVPVYNATAASDTFVPGDQVFLFVKNAGGVTCNVNVTVPAGREAIPALTIKTPLGPFAILTVTERMLGPFPASYFADPTTGLATVTFSVTASVTYAVLQLSKP